MLRKHQSEFEQITDRIISGEDLPVTYLHATPGAGKSCIPIQACNLIKAGLADRIAWMVPRLTLGYQAESNFIDPFFRKMFNHNYNIRTSTNEYNPCRGTQGFVTTYQAIGVDNKLTVLREFNEHRYIIVLDEWHHCELDGVWHVALKHIVDKAKFKIFMTGTLSRGDDKRIAWTPYKRTGKNTYEPDFNGEQNLIRYTRSDALREKAILPLKFFLHDGEIEYENKKGQIIKGKLSEQNFKTGDAIYTALSTKFAEDLLRIGLNHWIEHRKDHPSSKLMVVCADIKHTKQIKKLLDIMGFTSQIATSDDAKAIQVIKEFKHGSLKILVSVAMTYEGFDCKPLTHIIFLTHIRSIPWIEQVIARAVRIDPESGPYETQQGFIFAPDDPLFRSVVDVIKSEQTQAAKSTEKSEVKSENKGNGEKRYDIIPLNGSISGAREISLGEIPTGYTPPLTISEKESELRTRIDKHVCKFAFDNRHKPQKVNTEIKTHFRKARNLMELLELEECLKYVQEFYPLNGTRNNITGISQVRTKRRRVPTKAVPWPQSINQRR
ncbi:MAG: DEAD/DEAH box helicase family protein [Deltaproteobacteria bacterium]|nr:DEAD/DEAH box helicase family protein [Deltaproteobacteria bacterium]